MPHTGVVCAAKRRPWARRLREKGIRLQIASETRCNRIFMPNVPKMGARASSPAVSAPARRAPANAEAERNLVRRAQAGDGADVLVPGGEVEGQHPAEAEADNDARRALGDLLLGHGGEVLEPPQCGEVPRRVAASNALRVTPPLLPEGGRSRFVAPDGDATRRSLG